MSRGVQGHACPFTSLTVDSDKPVIRAVAAGPHPGAFKTPPTEPLSTSNGSWIYPVSAEIAAEWDLGNDEDDLDGEADD